MWTADIYVQQALLFLCFLIMDVNVSKSSATLPSYMLLGWSPYVSCLFHPACVFLSNELGVSHIILSSVIKACYGSIYKR